MKDLRNKHFNYFNIDKKENHNKEEDYNNKNKPINVDIQIIYKI